MKKGLKYLILVITLLTITTGCFVKREKITIKKDNYEVILQVKNKKDFKISQEITDFKSSREDYMLFGKNFNISIDFSNELSNPSYKENFKNLNTQYNKEKDYKEVTYNKVKGFQYYNVGYLRYDVYLPIPNDNMNNMTIAIYPLEMSEQAAKNTYYSKEVQDLLKHIIIKNNKAKK